MQRMTGTKRENVIKLWSEQIDHYIKRANDSAECFYRFSESSDLDHLIEDAENIIKAAKNAKEAIDFCNVMNIK